MNTEEIDRWFTILGGTVIIAAILGVGKYMGEGIALGTLPLWPYAAFAVLCAAIFMLYGYLVKDKL